MIDPACLEALADRLEKAPRAYRREQEIEEVTQIVAELRAIAAEAGWISVEDRLPEKSGFYLVYKGARISKKWYSSGVEPLIKFTHWQPLPPPPKPEAGRAD